MTNFSKGVFQPKNPAKYVGNRPPTWRSSWEQVFMTFLDNNDNIMQWGSECVVIPYRHPLDGKMHNYIPDFLITYRTKNNTTRAELVEIKPRKQSIIEEKMSSKERAIVAINYAKWDQATKWAKRNGLTFRVITESDIFHQGGKK
jgi:hypothetical protein